SLKAALAPCPKLQAVDLPDLAPLRAAARRTDCRVYFPVLAAHGPACRTSLKAALEPCPELQAVDLPNPAPGAPLSPRAMTAALLPPAPLDVAWQLFSPVRVAAPGELAALVALKWSFAPHRPAKGRRESSFALEFPAKPLAPKLGLGTKLSTQSEREIGEALGLDGKLAPWMAVSRFWKTAPADLKWLSVALPAVLLVALVSAVGWLPSKPVQTASQVQVSRPNQLQDAVRRASASVRRNIVGRAAVNLQDDFRSGLGEWEGRGNWGKGWQYDPAGFVLTGPLALFRPSLELTDYRFEFLGQIDKKSLNWVFRAADDSNYYAMKIVLLKSGPLAKAVIQRYAVIDGKPDRVVQTAMPMTGRDDTFLRVRVDVRGENFTTSVQDSVVDFWSDDRLDRGGVGFFSEKGERARLRWVEVSHQYDALGRLCALLAPYSIQPGNGSLDRQ
ncbi:MAG: hypothetical protein Q8N47_23720, partial [Bryobacterales bacterium]|nr:hypothetical protein [Bryobacterales bacterium]